MLKLAKITRIYLLAMFMLLIGATMNASNASERIQGEYMKAWNVCYLDFVQIEDLSDEEKDLLNYNVKFSETTSEIIIKLIPRILSEDRAKKFNRMALGREVEYVISKETYTIYKRIFYKG